MFPVSTVPHSSEHTVFLPEVYMYMYMLWYMYMYTYMYMLMYMFMLMYMLVCMLVCIHLHVILFYFFVLQAKAQMEESFRVTLEEKDEKIHVMQTQVETCMRTCINVRTCRSTILNVGCTVWYDGWPTL